MSGIVAPHIAASASLLEADDFNPVVDYVDLVEGDGQVEKVSQDVGSEDEEERDDYLDDEDDECYDVVSVDDDDLSSSLSEDETDADAVDGDITCDIAADEEICESQDCDESEVIVLQTINSEGEKFADSSMYLNLYVDCFS